MLCGREVWGRMDMCKCMAESFYCPPETIKTLLIGYMCYSVMLTLCDPRGGSLPSSPAYDSCCSADKSSPVLCGPMDCSKPGFPVLHYLLATKSLQSCPTLCEPIDGSPPGSPVPGILQARTLELVAISFSNA